MRIVVIGGGIAGMSTAYALATFGADVDVTVIEAEATLTHHTTGRSAAQLILNYGAAAIRSLTTAGLEFFHNPPERLVDGPLLEKRSVLLVGTEDQGPSIDSSLREGQAINPSVEEISPDVAVSLFPPLRAERVDRAILEADSYDIDVAALHQAFVRGAKANGVQISTTCAAVRLERSGAGWSIDVADNGLAVGDTVATLAADVVVNAAGAWGDVVAERAGVTPVGLQPMRRTAFMTPSGFDNSAAWPLVADVDHSWYIKPDGSQFLCSPADEHVSEPCDAKPEEIDVAIAIDRINTATTLEIRHVASSWAGLRTFSPDRSMVMGADPGEPSFVWCVGQGGTGIQTAPAAGQLIADLILEGEPGPSFAGHGLDMGSLAIDRFRG